MIAGRSRARTSLQEAALTSQGLKLWQTAYARFNGAG